MTADSIEPREQNVRDDVDMTCPDCHKPFRTFVYLFWKQDPNWLEHLAKALGRS